jgi:hypothetical protein
MRRGCATGVAYDGLSIGIAFATDDTVSQPQSSPPIHPR